MASTPDPDDAQLVNRCRNGDEAAWTLLVRRYERLIYTVPRRAGLADELAADVFQTVFAALHRHLHRIDDPTRLQAWLVTTAKRETLRILSKERRFVAFSGPQHDVGTTSVDPIESVADERLLPDEVLAELEENHLLRTAFAQLDDRCRDLLTNLYLADHPLTYAEISGRLGCAEGSIGPTRARCLDKLRRLLEAMGQR